MRSRTLAAATRLARTLAVAAIAIAAQAGDANAPAASDVVVAPVANSAVTTSFRLPGYATDAAATSEARGHYGDRIVLSGKALGGKATVTLFAEMDEPHASSAEWRTKMSRGSGAAFDVGDVACVDRSVSTDLVRTASFSALPVAAGYCFDLHVSAALVPGRDAPLTRESFAEIVKSFRVAVLRRGGVADYPDEVLALDDAAARRMPDHLAWLAAEGKARPADYVPQFLLAELMRVAKAPEADCVAPYTQALALLDRRRSPARAEQFVRAVAGEGLGLCLMRSGKHAEAVPHLQRAFEITTQLASPLRAPIAYNLACALARKGDAAKALDAVRLAIEANTNCRAKVLKDDDFSSLRALPAFQLMTSAVDETPPPDMAFASVPKTGVRISLRIPGFKDRADDIPGLVDRLGPNTILFGAAGARGDLLAWVIAVKDEPHGTSAEWRARILPATGASFEVGDVACVDLGDSSYFAFPVAGGWSFRLAVASGGTGDNAMPRAVFSEVVKSFRACCLTAGAPAEYPPEVLECMNGVATRMPTAWLDWVKAEATARPDDYVPPFVLGEALSFLRRPGADCVAPYTRALALLDKGKDPARATYFVRMLCEDNLGGVLSESGDFAGAAVHAQRATEAAKAIASPLRGQLLFRLACWQAKKGDAAKAIEALRAAIETMPSLREEAATDAFVVSLRDNPAFKALVASPPAPK